MLRLTLRTLLAYLDDTLEPTQARDIGKKVAESDYAQEMVERIKKVTRRRRISAPPVEGDDHSLDPNTIAEYLDNVLPADDVAELEHAALDQDVRLAEVSACHQILTLVLGEPARVPPTAHRRMYRLVSGPEALPYRQPAANRTPVAGKAVPAEVDAFHDHDEDLLESFLGPRSLLWLLCLLLAIVLLVVAILFAIPPAPPIPNQGYIMVAVPSPEPAPAIPAKKPDVPADPKIDVPDVPPKPTIEPDLGPQPRVVGEPPPGEVRPPDSERRVVAVYDTPPQPLLYRKRETIRWEKTDAAEGRVSSTDALLALPGFHPEMRLESGVRIQMWGNVPELLAVPVAESRVTLYVPQRGLDADLTLHIGRIYVSAPKAPRAMNVRVRFLEEVWDVTLADGDTEVAIDYVGEPAKGPLFDGEVAESPRFLVYLGVIQGTARVRSGFQNSGDLAVGAKWKWDSKAGRPGSAPKEDKDEVGVANRWSKFPPATPAVKDVVAAVSELARRVGNGQGPFDVDFDATIKEPREAIARRALSVWMLAAVDSLGYLIDALEADAAAVRDAAAKAIRHWCAEEPAREAEFAAVLATKAAFNDSQRALVTTLLHGSDRPSGETVDKLFELLRNEKLAVRELARLQLAKLDPAGARESRYDAGSDQRAAQAGAWERAWKKREGKVKG
jgi:hypothetical protein